MDTVTQEPTNGYEAFLAKPKKERKARTVPIESIDAINAIADSPVHAKTTGWAQSDIDTIGIGVTAVLIELTRMLSNSLVESDDLSMSREEAEAIANSVSRIILRHIKISKGKRGDVTDVSALLLAIISYGIRVSDGYARYKRKLKDAESKASQRSPSASNPTGQNEYQPITSNGY